MKTFRRISALAIALILSLTCVFTAFAESVKYYISDLGLSIYFPSEMSVVTKDTEGAALPQNVYLEAKTANSELLIQIFMEKAETHKDIYTSSDLEVVREELLEDDIFTGSREATYGGVDFLDFTEKQYIGNVVYYGRMSITLISGMKIYIHSQSAGDDFTSDELNLINTSLNSIEFDIVRSTQLKEAGSTVLGWVIAIAVILILIMLIAAYLLGRKQKKERIRKSRDRRRARNAEYDVLESAEENLRRQSQPGTVSGYKSSRDYFEQDFENIETKPRKERGTQKSEKKSPLLGVISFLKTLAEGLKILFTRIGYFFKNLSRSAKKGKKNSKRAKKRSRQARRGASKEYDVFRDK